MRLARFGPGGEREPAPEAARGLGAHLPAATRAPQQGGAHEGGGPHEGGAPRSPRDLRGVGPQVRRPCQVRPQVGPQGRRPQGRRPQVPQVVGGGD
eukprot:466881-Prorocentrum_minimum.AAC.10